MDSRKTIFLLLLVGILGAVVLWDHYKGKPTETRRTQAKRLLKFTANDVTRIELIRSNQTILLEKTDDRWQLRQPLDTRADFSAVRSILDELEFAERIRTLAGDDLRGNHLADYGLASPRQTVRLHTKTGTLALHFGADTPTGDAIYLQADGQPEILVARKSGLQRVNLSLDDLRSRRPLEFETAAATRIEIKAADRLLELTRQPGARWQLTRPLSARADDTKTDDLLHDLAGLRIQEFLSEKPEDVHTYGLAEPEREITVTTTNTTQTLLLGPPLTNDATKIIAKLKEAPSIFTLPSSAVKGFAVTHNDLRDTRLVPWTETEITGVDFGTFALERTNNTWHIMRPLPVAPDAALWRDALRELTGLRVQEFAADVATDLDRYGLANPARTITLTGSVTNQTIQLLISATQPPAPVGYVKRADEPFIYAVAADALARLPAHYGAIRDRTIFALEPDQITEWHAGNLIARRPPGGAWQLVQPQQGVLDTDALHEALQTFARLRAASFDRARTPADEALGEVYRAVTGTVTNWLTVTTTGFAAADTVELTFHLDAPIVTTLAKPLVKTPTP